MQLSVDLTTVATAIHVVHPEDCPEIGPICQVRDEPPQIHDQWFYVAELRPILELGLTRLVSLEVQLPLRLHRTTVRFTRLDGTPFTPDYPSIHHRNETLAGPGDPWLSARLSGQLSGVRLSGQLGMTLPLGYTVPNPFVLAEEGLPHQHVQFGTGTFNPLLGLEVSRAIGRVELRAFGQAQLALYENGHGYRAGHRFSAGVAGAFPIAGRLLGSVGADLFNEQPERWDGEILQEGNLGRTDVLVGASLAYPLGDLLVTLGAKVPVYQHLIQAGLHDPGQLTSPAVVGLDVRRIFDLAGRRG